MRNKWLILLLCVAAAVCASAQVQPMKVAAFVSTTGTLAGPWEPLTGSGGTAVPNLVPMYVAIFYSTDGTGNPGTWAPCTTSCFGGVSSVANSDGTLTISPTTGAVVASLNLAHANTWSAIQTFSTAPTFSGLTGYVYANGASQVGAATTIPLGSVVSTAGILAPLYLANATSGLITLEPGTGAITSYTIQLPVAQPSAGNTSLSCTAANPTVCTWVAPGGSGTVTVVGSGNLTSTALVTGGGSQALQTPSTTSTLDASGNLSVAAGGSLGSADTGTPKFTFATNKITVNQPLYHAQTSNQEVFGTSTNLTTLTFPVPSGAVTLTYPNTSEYMVGANSDTTTTHVLHATTVAGVGNFAAIAAGDLPAALSSSTSINKVTITAPATSATLTIADSTTLTETFSMNVAKTAGVAGAIPWYDTTTTESASALLTHYGVMIGGGASAAPSTIAADTTTTHALFATASAPAFRAVAAGDLPTTLTSGTIVPAAGITPQSVDCHTACSPTAAQLSNARVWNYGQAAANVQVTGPTVAAGMNFFMVVGTAQGANYWRYTSTTANIYLDGGASAVTNIIFAAPAVGNSFSCFSFQIGASTYALKCTTLAGTSTSS